MPTELETALELVTRFERDDTLSSRETGKLLAQVFTACGFPVRQSAICAIGTRNLQVDFDFNANLGGREQRFVVELNLSKKPVAGIDCVRRAITFRNAGGYDRALVISRSGFTTGAVKEAERSLLSVADLLSPADLRSWVEKHASSQRKSGQEEHRTCTNIIRAAMREIATRLAEHPDELQRMEWRDLERVLREVFEGIGFDTTLTRSGKDGGFDLELRSTSDGIQSVYLVEVKHWAEKRPGSKEFKKLVKVAARCQATGGLLLSTSGFSNRIFKGIAEAERMTVRLGNHRKILSLCRTYYRLGTELWIRDQDLQEVLFEETV
jgi:hypothetical protein